MNRFYPRFLNPIEPLNAPPIGNVQFRPPQGGGMRMGGGMSAGATGMGHGQPQQGGGGMGGALAAGGLLGGLGGPTATSVMDPAFVSQAAGWGSPAAAGAWPEIATSAGGGGGGLLGSLGGVGGGMTGADLSPMADLGLEAAGGAGGAGTALSSMAGPAALALSAPGLMNGIFGTNIPDPIKGLLGVFGL